LKTHGNTEIYRPVDFDEITFGIKFKVYFNQKDKIIVKLKVEYIE